MPNIIEAIDKTFSEFELTSQVLDRELAKVVFQNEELATKLSAIKHWNEINLRIEKAKQKALDKKDISTDVLTIWLPQL